MRLKNSLMMGLAVLIGEIIVDPKPSFWPVLSGFYTALSLTAAAMVTNDYFDMEVDAINEPERPLPKGIISPRNALFFSFLLSVTGLASAYTLSLTCLIIAFFFLALSVLYNAKGKVTGLIGNMMVSACVAAPFLYGGFAVGATPNVILLVFAGLAFLSNTGREVTKGIVDVEGDKLRNSKTIAIQHGAMIAASLATLFYLSSVLLSFIPLVLGVVNSLYLPLILITDTGFLSSSISLIKDPSKENSRKTKKLVLAWMSLGLLSLILGGLRF